ncbi:hypothetical protein M9458_050760, partial [Cirrhinus mrigala]
EQELRPSAVAAQSEADAELGSGWRSLRLDDWFPGKRSAAPPLPPPVPFFPEVHDELVRAWRAPYSARSRPTSSALTTLDGGAAKGYAGVSQVEGVRLRCIYAKACRLSSALTGRAYSAAGQAATALHAIGTLQVYQAMALKELHKGSPDQAVMQELRAATDFALRATKVTAQSLGRVMSTLVVQERHLWLNLAQMADVDKARFLDAPVSQAGLFGDTFSAVQKQTEAIRHILPRRETLRNLLVAEGAPLRPPRSKNNRLRLRLRPTMRPSLLRGQPPRPADMRSAPDTGSPEMMEVALRVTITSAPPLPEEGRDLLCVQPPSTHGKSSFSHLWANDATPPRVQTRSPHSPAREPGKKTFLQDVHPSGISPLPAGNLGLWVNREKRKLSPVQRISFLGMELDSVNMTACLTNERMQSFRHKTAAPGAYGSCSRGNTARPASYETASALATRSSPEMGMAPVAAYSARGQTLPSYGPEHVVVYTDASTTGWGAVCNGQAASDSWTGPRLLWHINCLELLAVLLALRRFLLMLRHKQVLVRTDNTATVAYINHQGGLRSRRMSQLARHLLLWSQTRLKSPRTVHIPGELNRAADQLSRQPTHPGEWRLHPQTVQLIWSRFGEAQIDLFASPESSPCQLYYSLSEAPLGRDALAHSWPPGP